ncbi:Ig-like domain-containing protein [Massilia sp. B-10]|nr:Ig-like domain-containing protein [Massilia sp. B-10]
MRWVNVELDATAPVASVATPVANAQLGLMVPVSGTARDEHFAVYRLEYATAANPEGWSVLAQENTQTEEDKIKQFASWNTLGLSGDVSLRLVALDQAGNITTIALPLVIVQNAHQISYLEAVPALISPNGDNKRDSAAIRFGLLGEGKVTLDIRRDNPLGALVRTLIASETAVPGAITKVWDGKDNAQEVVSDGTYVARLSFASLGDVVDVQEESVQIVVDRNAPQVVIHSPVADFVTPLDSVRISATDLHASKTVKIYRSSGTNLSDWKLDAELTGDQREHTLFDLSDMEEGKYGVRVVATDLAENTTDVVKLFTVDKTAPVVSLAMRRWPTAI